MNVAVPDYSKTDQTDVRSIQLKDVASYTIITEVPEVQCFRHCSM